MNITRSNTIPKPEKWARYKYCLTNAIGEGGKHLAGCDEHIALSRKVADEGMVLLENNGILPLKEGTTVSLFGIGSIDYVKGGGGSGMVYSAYVRNLYEGFIEKSPKIKVYEPVTKFYYDYAVPLLAEHAGYTLYDEIEVPSSLVSDAANNSDVAIITIHRFSREGLDRFSEKGDFYLTDVEQKMVDDVTAAFEHSVVVLNVGGMVDVSWIKSNPKIDAALLAWQAGMEGGLAVADILSGDVNPSGKLTDTFAKEFSDYPSADTFNESRDYVAYYEDIYVGYRYFETIKGAAERVNYPFGYGLSYTTFDISKPVARLDGENIKVSVTVKNTGSLAGKEVVQCYFSAPQGVLGKAKVSLAAFKKTKLLAPEESEDIELIFPVSDMSCYDDLGKLQMSAYLLEGGEYTFLVGNNCRDLTAADYKYVVKEKFVVTKQLSQKCAPNKLEKRMLSDGSFEALPSFPVKDYSDVTAPKNTAKAPEEETPFRKVADGQITLDEFMAQMTDEELIKLVCGAPNNGITITNTGGFGGINRLGVPVFMTADGPAGVRLYPIAGISTTAWPCATLIACTWEPDLAYEIGRAGGLEAKETGFPIWLTPALNIHRNPLCGRNFEYFSEDPLVAGKFAAAKTKGIQSQNIAASAKHFACNNKETNRKESDSRVSERALREIYLKAFEMIVKKADPYMIMTSYNIINGVQASENKELVTDILRGEWGYQGMVTSDWWTHGEHYREIKAGNDLKMAVGYPERVKEAFDKGFISREELEVSAKRVLRLLVKLD